MKKADGWSMGQEEQKKKALEEKLRRRAYTAAFEAAQQRKEKPWQSWDEAFSERLAKQPFITEEERKPFAPSGAGAQNAFYTGEKQPWPGLGEAWPGQARRAERTPWAALPENLPSGAGTMLLAGQRRSMAQATPGGEPPAGPEQGVPGFALEGVDPAYRDAVYAGQALAELLRPKRRKAGTETGKALQPGGGYGTLKKGRIRKAGGMPFWSSRRRCRRRRWRRSAHRPKVLARRTQNMSGLCWSGRLWA